MTEPAWVADYYRKSRQCPDCFGRLKPTIPKGFAFVAKRCLTHQIAHDIDQEILKDLMKATKTMKRGTHGP